MQLMNSASSCVLMTRLHKSRPEIEMFLTALNARYIHHAHQMIQTCSLRPPSRESCLFPKAWGPLHIVAAMQQKLASLSHGCVEKLVAEALALALIYPCVRLAKTTPALDRPRGRCRTRTPTTTVPHR